MALTSDILSGAAGLTAPRNCSKIEGMKVFVTGGTGFIGSHLIDSLLAQNGSKVFALVRDPRNLKWLEGKDIQGLHGDLLSIPELPSDLDYIFHLAGSTKAHKSADYYTVNQSGTASLFQALNAQGIRPKRVIHLSSLAASGPSQPGRPLKEDDPPRPVSPYGRSKLQGEVEALRFSREFPLLILRVGPVFGPRDRDFLSYFKFLKMGILPSFGSGSSLMSVCYVRDLVRAMLLSLTVSLGTGEILNIADPTPYTWDEFGKTAAQCLDKRPRQMKFPLPLVYAIAIFSEFLDLFKKKPGIISLDKIGEMRQSAWVADTRKAEEVMGFRTEVPLAAALEETFKWYSDHDWL